MNKRTELPTLNSLDTLQIREQLSS